MFCNVKLDNRKIREDKKTTITHKLIKPVNWEVEINIG